MADKVHVIKKTVRLMPSEASVLAEKAKANGMNEAEYIRLLISQKPNDYPEIRKLLKELINEVNRIGVNINQITFHHNVELYSKEDKEQLIAYMRKLNLEVKKVVDMVGN
jgi:hypothetical protein